jgi:hypothetical protein
MDLLDDDEYLYNPYSEYSAAAGGSGNEDEASDDEHGYLTDPAALASQPAQPQIFALQNTQWKAKQYGGARIKHLAAASGVLYVATDRGRLVRWNLSTGDEQEIVIDAKRNDVIFKVYVDPSGLHVIIAGTQGENWYVSVARGLKARTMALSKRVRIESVCWDRAGCDEINTGIILIGTSTGAICKANIVDGKEKYWKEIFSLQDSAQPICGLECELFPTSAKVPTERRYLIMAATPTRYYEFIGGPTYDALFGHYLAASGGGSPCFIELPGDIDYSSLHFKRKANRRATSFVWLTGPGIYSAKLSFGSQNAGDSIIYDYKLIPYGSGATGGGHPASASLPNPSPPQSALAVLSTEFHWLVLFAERLEAVEHLSEELVWEKVLGSRHMYGDMRGMAMDPATNRIWVYADYMINEVVMSNEDQLVWRRYLAKGQFDTALQYCTDLQERELVLTAQADHYFDNHLPELAASIYAKTKSYSFEHVCLKLIGTGDKEAVRRYLSDKLDHMRATDRAQLTMCSTWLTEIYLDKLNAAQAVDCGEEYQQVLEEVRQVVQDHVKYLDPATTYHLMLHHGRIDVLLYYAELMADHDRIISHHIQRGEWTKAVEVLGKSVDPNLYYRHAPTLMQHAPVGTTNALIKATRDPSFKMDPRLVLPALMRYQHADGGGGGGGAAAASKGKEGKEERGMSGGANEGGSKAVGSGGKQAVGSGGNQALRFLLHCVKNLKSTDAVICKMLVSVVAQEQDDKGMVALLLDALASGFDGSIDLEYTYRACQRAGKKEACVMILSLMGRHAEAVERALEMNDVELAKENAHKLEDDEEVRKQVWLKIAKFLVEQTRDVKAAMSLMTDTHRPCPLTVEDVLPLFPDFAVIDDLQEAICASLEDYQRHIQDLKRGMQDASKSSELIRKDMNEVRSRFAFVKSSDLCRLCATPVLTSPLYLFPCQHAVHVECVEHYMLHSAALSEPDKKRVKQLKASLEPPDVKKARSSTRTARDPPKSDTGRGKAGGDGGGAALDDMGVPSADCDYARIQVCPALCPHSPMPPFLPKP